MMGAGNYRFNRITIGFLWSHLFIFTNSIYLVISAVKPRCALRLALLCLYVSVLFSAFNHSFTIVNASQSSSVTVVLWPWWNNQKEGQAPIFQPWAVLTAKIVSSFTKSSEPWICNRELSCRPRSKKKVPRVKTERGFICKLLPHY